MNYINRELESEILNYMKTPEMIAVVGTRQCGKTTMVNHLLDKFIEKGKKINKLSFDNRKILMLFEEDIDSFIDIYVKPFDIIFIDEIQYSRDSGKKLKYIYDKLNKKIIISGSSAAEISIQCLKFLVGRILIFTLYPFSFREFLSSKDSNLLLLFNKGNYKSQITNDLNNYIYEFLLYGGYPRVVLAKTNEEKIKLLEGIFSTFLLKEIREILDLSKDYEITSLVKILSLNIGNLINFNELSNVSKCEYYELKRFLNLLEKTFICSLIKPFYTHKNRELTKNPKPYFFDLGFRNTSINNFSKERTDIGNMYENLIFSELAKNKKNVKFWNTKSKAEVDFILQENEKIIPIEVKSNINDLKITKSFASFIEKYKPKKGYFLSLNFEGKKEFKGCKVIFLPFVKFISKIKEI